MAVLNLPDVALALDITGQYQPSGPLAPLPGLDLPVDIRLAGQPTLELSLSSAFTARAALFVDNAFQSARVSSLAQELSTENIVSLFELDLSRYGLGLACFTTEVTENNQPLRWGGKTYAPAPVEAKGFERKSGGVAARPTLSIGNVTSLLSALIIEGKDLIGCEVRRIRTFRRFLDDGLEPSTTDHFPTEVYRVERKISQNRIGAEFELASILDQEGTQLPRRQIVRDYCNFVYRRWDGAGERWTYDPFDPCPYAGEATFNARGEREQDPAKDVCGKKLRDCKLRFGARSRLYSRAFPGVGRVQ